MPSEAKLETWKAQLEYYRYLGTLSTGAIVLIATFLEKTFPAPTWKGVVVVSLIGFGVSIISSVTAYWIFLNFFNDEEEEKTLILFALPMFIVASAAAWLGFLVGIIGLAIFAVINII